MKERGVVREIKGKEAIIEVMPGEECTKCCSCGSSRPRRITVAPEEINGAVTGDEVEVEIMTGSMMKVYFLVYGLPLMVFVVSILAAHKLSGSPAVSFLSAIVATTGAYLLVGKAFKARPGLTPLIRVRKL